MTEQNQHYVPKFLLKNFTDANGRVFCLDTQSDNVTKPPPKLAASSIGFNELEIRGETVSFEKRLEKIETRAAKSFRKIIDANSLAPLTSDDRKNIADFVASQSFRTEAFRQGLVGVAKSEIGELFESLWQSAFVVSKEIEGRHWLLMKIEHDGVFYLGDNPVVLQNTEKPAEPQSLGFDVRGIEAYLPITPKHALYMPCRSTSNEIIAGYESGVKYLDQVRSIVSSGQDVPGVDASTVAKVEQLLQNPRAFHESITTGSPQISVPENVENLNYLQCAFSHRHVFSNHRDFTFAKMVFAKSPQYRKTMQSRVEQVPGMRILVKTESC